MLFLDRVACTSQPITNTPASAVPGIGVPAPFCAFNAAAGQRELMSGSFIRQLSASPRYAITDLGIGFYNAVISGTAPAVRAHPQLGSILAVFKVVTAATDGHIVCGRHPTVSNAVSLRIVGSKLRFSPPATGLETGTWRESATTLVDGGIYSVFAYSTSVNVTDWHIYINGVLDDGATLGTSTTVNSSRTHAGIRFGCNPAGTIAIPATNLAMAAIYENFIFQPSQAAELSRSPWQIFSASYPIKMPGGSTYNVSSTESLTLADAITNNADFVVGISESITASDAITNIATLIASATESSAFSDALANNVDFVVGVTESGSLGDGSESATPAIVTAGAQESLSLGDSSTSALLWTTQTNDSSIWTTQADNGDIWTDQPDNNDGWTIQ